MSFSVVQSAKVDQATVTSGVMSVTLPSPVTANNLIVYVFGTGNGTATVSSVSDSKGNAYSQTTGSPQNTSGPITIFMFYAVATTGGSSFAVQTNGFANGSSFAFEMVAEISGAATSSPQDNGNGSVGSSATGSTTFSTTNASCILIGGYIPDFGGETPGTGFSLIQDCTTCAALMEFEVVSSAGSQTVSATGGNGPWAIVGAAFKAAGGGGPSAFIAPNDGPPRGMIFVPRNLDLVVPVSVPVGKLAVPIDLPPAKVYRRPLEPADQIPIRIGKVFVASPDLKPNPAPTRPIFPEAPFVPISKSGPPASVERPPQTAISPRPSNEIAATVSASATAVPTSGPDRPPAPIPVSKSVDGLPKLIPATAAPPVSPDRPAAPSIPLRPGDGKGGAISVLATPAEGQGRPLAAPARPFLEGGLPSAIAATAAPFPAYGPDRPAQSPIPRTESPLTVNRAVLPTLAASPEMRPPPLPGPRLSPERVGVAMLPIPPGQESRPLPTAFRPLWNLERAPARLPVSVIIPPPDRLPLGTYPPVKFEDFLWAPVARRIQSYDVWRAECRMIQPKFASKLIQPRFESRLINPKQGSKIGV